MGAGKGHGKVSSIMDPPLFEPEQDLLVWRKKVAAWVDLVTTAANKGPDRTYKSIAATLAHHLYERGLPQPQKSIVDEVQVLGKIDYKQDDQVKGVQQIVDIVAVDPPIAVVTRLIDSFNKVTTCKKRNNEDLNRFLSRYRGLAAEHLMPVGTTTSSQVGEILAINLLQNANLPEATLTNAKINLIHLAETRKEKESDDPYQVSSKHVDSIVEAFKELRDLESNLENDDINSQEDAGDVLITILPVISSVIKKLQEPFKELERTTTFRHKENVTKSITTTGPRCVLSLDDAVNVLRSLAQTVTKIDTRTKEQTPSEADEIQKVVKEQLRSYFANNDHNGHGSKKGTANHGEKFSRKNNWKRKGSSNSDGSQARPFKRRYTDRDSNDSQKANKIIDNDVCKDCGSKLHIRGDPKCDSPSYFTMKIAEARQDRSKSNDERDKDEKSDRKANFRQGSKRVRFKGV